MGANIFQLKITISIVQRELKKNTFVNFAPFKYSFPKK